jgi:hypothetical protein
LSFICGRVGCGFVPLLTLMLACFLEVDFVLDFDFDFVAVLAMFTFLLERGLPGIVHNGSPPWRALIFSTAIWA